MIKTRPNQDGVKVEKIDLFYFCTWSRLSHDPMMEGRNVPPKWMGYHHLFP